MLLVLHFALGLDPRSRLRSTGSRFSRRSCSRHLQFLSASFGAVGKFLSIVLLMLQLTSAAGTFPIETVPRFFQVINPFLPMTYVVVACARRSPAATSVQWRSTPSSSWATPSAR